MDIQFKKKLSKSKLMPIDNGHRYTEHKSLFVWVFVFFFCLFICLFVCLLVFFFYWAKQSKKMCLCCKLKFSNPYIFVTFDYLI